MAKLDRITYLNCFVTVDLNLWVDRAIELPEQATASMRKEQKRMEQYGFIPIERANVQCVGYRLSITD